MKRIGSWLGVTPSQALFLALSLPLALIVPIAAGPLPRMVSPVAAVCAWLLSITLAIAGAITHNHKRIQISKSTLLWAGFLVVIAFIFRGVATEHFPIALTGDEGSAGVESTYFIDGKWNNIFVVGWLSFPSLFFFIQSLPIRILGQTTTALRTLSALVGALTVVATYLAGKKMFNQRVGLIAALSLAALHFHVHFSRIALNNIWDGLWYVIVIGAVWVGWQEEDRRAYVLAGVGLGFSQYFYITSRALFVLLFASFVLAFLLNRQKLYRALPHIFVMLLVTAVIFLPLAWFYVKFPPQYFAPFNRASALGNWLTTEMQITGLPAWRILTKQISTGFQAFTFTPLLFWYKPEIPILQPLPAALFYIGLLLLVLRYRDGQLVLLTLWLTAIALAGGLSESTPAAQRYVAGAPVCSLLVGIGLDGAARTLSAKIPRAIKFFSVLAFVTITGIMINDLYFYFVTYTQKNIADNTHNNVVVAQQLADELKDKPAGTQVFFFGVPRMGYHSFNSIAFLAPQVEGIDINIPWNSLGEKPEVLSAPAFFVFLPEQEVEIKDVQNDYPGGTLTTERTWNNEILFWVYEVHMKP